MKRIMEAVDLQPGDAFDVCLEVYSKKHTFLGSFTSVVQHIRIVHRNPPLSLPPFTPCAVEIECKQGASITVPGPTLVEVFREVNHGDD